MAEKKACEIQLVAHKNIKPPYELYRKARQDFRSTGKYFQEREAMLHACFLYHTKNHIKATTSTAMPIT